MNKKITQLMIAVSLAVMALSTVFIGLVGPAVAANTCVAPGGSGGCFSTIQAAVNAASIGDTVSVVAGIYTENIVITKNLTLLGGFDNAPPDAARTPRSTIINGGAAGVVISITNSANVTVNGFTITNGDATTNNKRGGGIYVGTANATIVDNLIENNVASSDSAVGGAGGGIYAITSTIVISGNTIQSNKAYSATTGSVESGGGGIAVSRATEATIVNNDILSNTAAYLTASSTSAQGFGGGIKCSGDKLVVEGNTIQNNLAISAGTFGVGGGLEIFGTLAITLTNNVIVENTVMITGTGNAYGGGVSAGGFDGVGRRIVITGNQIMSNTTMVNGNGSTIEVNGGVNLFGAGTPDDSVLLQNNSIIGNVALKNAVPSGSTAGGYVDGAAVVIGDITSTQVISNNISNNVAVADSDGTWTGDSAGGIHISANDMALVMNNYISANISNAGGMNIWKSVVTSTNNIFANNSRVGLRASGSSPPSTVSVINDTFYNNGVAGIQSYDTGTQVLVTNTIVFSHELGLEVAQGDGAILIGNFNLLQNTTNYDPGITPGGQDITGQNPLLSNAANNDFHLASDSPAIDKGTSVGAPAEDFEGDTRPQGNGIDIGADESPYEGTWQVYLPIIIK